VSDLDQQDQIAELAAREPLFHRPELGTRREDFEAMTTEDFREVGAAGIAYDRATVLDVLERRHAEPHDDTWTVEELRGRALAPDAWLVTYLLHQGERVTRRGTLWLRIDGDWRAAYHQGTPAGGS